MFHVGQKVVCVDDGPIPEDDHDLRGVVWIVKAQVYTVAEIDMWESLITVEEMPCFDNNGVKYGWQMRRFRPVRTTDISIFEAMLVPTPKERELVTVDDPGCERRG